MSHPHPHVSNHRNQDVAEALKQLATLGRWAAGLQSAVQRLLEIERVHRQPYSDVDPFAVLDTEDPPPLIALNTTPV